MCEMISMFGSMWTRSPINSGVKWRTWPNTLVFGTRAKNSRCIYSLHALHVNKTKNKTFNIYRAVGRDEPGGNRNLIININAQHNVRIIIAITVKYV
jgi:hypothetical protein